MTTTLAFDVYGTLIDTHGVVRQLREHLGERAEAFSQRWRDKQLEYAFRRGLMQDYADFAVCTRQALDYTDAACGAGLSAAVKQQLLQAYGALPAFADVSAGLREATQAGLRLFAFSNGTAAAVEALLQHAGIREFFRGVVSVDEVRSFKPDPAVYRHFLRTTGATADATWLVSANPFDLIGAMAAGLRGVWLRRSPDAPFDPWGIDPSLTVGSLRGLAAAVAAAPGA
jgi:2-haloacid dehalogenase